MGGRKKSSASASQAAADLFAKTGVSSSDVPSVGNFAFGSRFAGQLSSQQQQAQEEKPSSSARHGYGIDTSPEVRGYIQHLSKPDSRTRHKALLGLKVALEENPDLGAALLQYWSTQFSKMMKDPSKHVRIASCQVTATLSKSVGRKMGAIIKDVFPPLYFAQFDEQDVGVIASNVMQAMLPGDKSNAAVDLCTDKILESIKQAIESLGGGGCQDDQICRLVQQHLRGAKQILIMRNHSFSKPFRDVLETPCFQERCLHGKHIGLQRDAYNVVSEVSFISDGDSAQNRQFIKSAFKTLVDCDSSNYLDMMSMVIALSKGSPGVWNMLDSVEKEFHLPLRKIARRVNQNNSLIDINKTFLPMISVIPRGYCQPGQLCLLMDEVWNTHAATSHVGRSCALVQETVAECMFYFVSKDGDSKDDIFSWISDKVLHGLECDSDCCYSMFVLFIERIHRLKHLERRFAEYMDELLPRVAQEDAVTSCGPLIASMGTRFIQWQVNMLDRSVHFSENFWISSRIDFACLILRNMWYVTRDGELYSQISQSRVAVQSLLDRLSVNLIERLRSSGEQELWLTGVACACFLSNQGADMLSEAINSLCLGAGPNVASTLVDLMRVSEIFPAEKSNDLRSSNLDAYFLGYALEAIQNVDVDLLALCKALLVVKSDTRFVTDAGIETLFKSLMEEIEGELSIDSKAVLLQLLSITLESINAIPSFVDRSTVFRSIFTFILKLCWEEILLDMSGKTMEDLDVIHLEMMNTNQSLLSSCDVMKNELLWQCTLSEPPIDSWIKDELLPEISDAIHVSEHGHVGTENLPAIFCFVRFCFRSLLVDHDLDLVSGLWPLLRQLPEITLRILEGISDPAFNSLLLEERGVRDVCCLFEQAKATEISRKAVTTRLMENVDRYKLILDEMAVLAEQSEKCVGLLTELLVEGLIHEKDAIKACAISFCRSNLFIVSINPRYSDVLRGVVVEARSAPSLLHQSGLVDHTRSLLSNPSDFYSHIDILGRCFPSFGTSQRLETSSLIPGAPVWYRDTVLDWKKGIIVSRDDSIQPPSFMVDVGTSTRETEANRLRTAQSGMFLMPKPQSTPLHSTLPLGPLLYEQDEIEKLLEGISTLVCQPKDFWQPQNGAGRHELILFAVWHLWDQLPPGVRDEIMEIVVSCLSSAFWAMHAMIERFFASLIDQVNEMSGADFACVSDVFDFMSGLQQNPALNRLPKVQMLYESLYSEIEEVTSCFGGPTTSNLSAHIYAFIRIENQELPSDSRSKIDSFKKRASVEILSICYGVAHVFTAIQSIYGTGHESKANKVWEGHADLWEALSIGLHSSNVSEVVIDARERNVRKGNRSTLLSLCLNSGMSGVLARAAFRILVQCQEELNGIFSIDSESFYDNIEGVISNSRTDKVSTMLHQCGLDANVAVGLSSSVSEDFKASWTLIICYLMSCDVDNAQKDLLVTLLKEFGLLIHRIVEQTVDMLEVTSDKSVHLAKCLGDDGSTICENFVAYLRYINDDGNSFTSPGDVGLLIPEDVLLFALLVCLPVSLRNWFIELKHRKYSQFVEEYVKLNISPILIAEEFRAIRTDSPSHSSPNFHVRSISATNQVHASMDVDDDHSIDLKISFPREYPLKAASAVLDKYVGMSEARARKWNLSITAFLMNRNGSVNEAIQMWKKNVGEEFEGHEDCLICYSIIQPSTGQLPRLRCKTCGLVYHGTCLYKWFKTSGKSNCVHCQSPW